MKGRNEKINLRHLLIPLLKEDVLKIVVIHTRETVRSVEGQGTMEKIVEFGRKMENKLYFKNREVGQVEELGDEAIQE